MKRSLFYNPPGVNGCGMERQWLPRRQKAKWPSGHQVPPGERAAPPGLPWVWSRPWTQPPAWGYTKACSTALGCSLMAQRSINGATVRPGKAGRGCVQPHSDTAGMNQRVHTTVISRKNSRKWPSYRAGQWSFLEEEEGCVRLSCKEGLQGRLANLSFWSEWWLRGCYNNSPYYTFTSCTRFYFITTR